MQGIQSISPQTVQGLNALDNTTSANAPKVILVDKPDTVEFSQKAAPVKKSKTGKKWGVGIASLILPGLGQACNGQWGKGALYFGGQLALTVLAGMAALSCPPIAILGSLGLIAIRVASIVDAVKNV